MNIRRESLRVATLAFHEEKKFQEYATKVEKAIENYIDCLKSAGFIEYFHPFWRITQSSKAFLERHGE
jgi:hypothetical protein